MKRYIRSNYYQDAYGNKIPYNDNLKQDFIVNKTYTAFTEEDLDGDIEDITGYELEDYEAAGLYRPGRGVVLKVGTRLNWSHVEFGSYAIYTLPDYGNITIAVLANMFHEFRKHVRPANR